MSDDLKTIKTYSPFPEDHRSIEDKVKGVGLRTGASDLDRSDDTPIVKKDAEGQFAASQADRTNNGMVSAAPRSLSPHGQSHTADQRDVHGRDPDDRQGRNKL